jgi:hypothetical protein
MAAPGRAARFTRVVVRAALLALSLPLLQGCGHTPASAAAGLDGAPPHKLVVRVPAAFSIERGLDALTVRVDPAALASTEIDADVGAAFGVESEIYAFARGQARPDQKRRGLVAGTDFERTRVTWTTEQDGIPRQGTKYVVEMSLVLFETDTAPAPAHAWDPHAGRYKVLWTRTLRQSEE